MGEIQKAELNMYILYTVDDIKCLLVAWVYSLIFSYTYELPLEYNLQKDLYLKPCDLYSDQTGLDRSGEI